MYRVCVYRSRPPTVLSVLMALCPLTLGAALAQESAPPKAADSQHSAPARALPRPDQLEPAVDTTRSAPAAATPAAPVGAAPDANAAGGPRKPPAAAPGAPQSEPQPTAGDSLASAGQRASRAGG